jgi:hypothetical protein
MKKALCLAFLTAALAAFAMTAHTEAPSPSGAQASVQPTAEILVPAPVQAVTLELPACGAYDGQACTTPGEKFKCQWIPGEPGRCACQGDHLWHCG